MSDAEYAAHRVAQGEDSCTRQAVSWRRRRGLISSTPSGRINAMKADTEWPIGLPKPGRKPGQKSPPKAPATTPEPDAPAQQPAELTPHQRKAQAEAERTELDLAKRRGEVVALADVARTARDFARRIRDVLLEVPVSVQACVEHDVVCASCGAGFDAKQVALAVDRHLRELLRSLADNPMGGETT